MMFTYQQHEKENMKYSEVFVSGQDSEMRRGNQKSIF